MTHGAYLQKIGMFVLFCMLVTMVPTAKCIIGINILVTVAYNIAAAQEGMHLNY